MCVYFVFCFFFFFFIGTGGPSIIYEGKDALLTCVVSENRSNNTVIWKKSGEILTAGKVRVTSDHRISVLHDESKFNKIKLLSLSHSLSISLCI